MKHRLIFKRMIAALSAFLICAGAMPTDGFVSRRTNNTALTAYAAEYSFSDYETHKDETDAVFLISSCSELTALANAVNNGNTFAGKTFKLTADITEAVTTPIGSQDGDYTTSKPFEGIFDGQGHTVKLDIKNKALGGLFGYIENSTIKNVITTGTVTGAKEGGGICGYSTSNSTITNCTNYAVITGIIAGGICGNSNYNSKISNCVNKGKVNGLEATTMSEIGGICGYIEDTIINNCSNTAPINGLSFAGGICGFSSGRYIMCVINNCSNTGLISGGDYSNAGGISGVMYCSIATNCYNLADIENPGATIGGICASIRDSSIENCYSRGAFINKSTEEGCYGGIWGYTENGQNTATYCYYDNTIYPNGTAINNAEDTDTVKGLPSNECKGKASLYEILNTNVTVHNANLAEGDLEWSTWYAVDEVKDGDNILIKSTYPQFAPYEINNIDDLYLFAEAVNSGYDYSGKTVVLNADIEEEFRTVIGKDSQKFSGTFDGQGHTIKLVINDSVNGYSKGLFGNLYYATVKNVNVTGSITTRNNSGGICGYCNYSTVENCSSNVTIKGGGGVGGVVGLFEYGTIVNCSSNSNITTITGDAAMLGGVVGAVRKGKVLNCYSNGTITHTSTNTMQYFGGVCGWMQDTDCTIENCYSSSEIKSTGASMTNTVGGAVGGMYGNASNYYYDSTKCSLNGGFGTKLITTKCQGAAFGQLEFRLNCGAYEHNKNLAEGETPWSYWNAEDEKYPVFGNNQFNATVEISTKAELEALADMVNTGLSLKGITIKLTADIKEEVTTIIGSESAPFSGTFDGQRHTVNLNINGNRCVGLFGYTVGVVIKNLNVTGSVRGTRIVGGICGWACYDSVIVNCSNNAVITGSNGNPSEYVGGICGAHHQSKLYNCYNNAAVNCDGNYVGGISGEFIQSEVANCYNSAKVIHNSTNTTVGGICGRVVNQSTNPSRITDCYYDETVYPYMHQTGTTPSIAVGTDYPENETLKGLSTAESKGKNSLYNTLNQNVSTHNNGLTDGDINWSAWCAVNEVKEGTTILVNATYPQFVLCEINNIDDLYLFAEAVNSGYDYSGETVVLNADIEEEVTTIIGTYTNDNTNAPFSGTFDGQGHTINLNINKPGVSNTALFGYSENATIKNVNLIGKVVGHNSTGCLCGYAKYVTIENCSNSAILSGGGGVGAICGCFEHGTIVNCSNYADVTGAISGNREMIGGICGALRTGKILNCYNNGNVHFAGTDNAKQVGGVCGWIRDAEGLVENCYSSGEITYQTTCNTTVGGAVGDIGNGSAANCYYDSTKCSLTGGFGTKLTTSKCQGEGSDHLYILLNANTAAHNSNLTTGETAWLYWIAEENKYPVLTDKIPLELMDLKLSVNNATYTGSPYNLTVKLGDEIISDRTDFTITYKKKNNTGIYETVSELKDAGNYKVVVTATDDNNKYFDTSELDFNVMSIGNFAIVADFANVAIDGVTLGTDKTADLIYGQEYDVTSDYKLHFTEGADAEVIDEGSTPKKYRIKSTGNTFGVKYDIR